MNKLYAEKTLKLFTPGPVNIPNRISVASSYVHYHHRTNEFSNILLATLERLKEVFGTNNQVLPVHASGRGALEGVYNNIFTQEDRIICVCNGNFGEMAAKTLKKNRLQFTRIFDDWEVDMDLALLEEAIVREKATAITVVHNDTSNGVVNPIKEIGKLAKKYNLLLTVDTVSSLACMPFKLDEWGVDAAVTASQKGLMSPPGISFVALSQRAMEICENNDSRDFYIDFVGIRDSLANRKQTPGTTPVSLVLGVNEALNMIEEEGLDNVYARHRAISLASKSAFEALGFKLFPENTKVRSDSLTVCMLGENMDVKSIVAQLDNKYGIKIANGIGKYFDATMRVAHMGYCYVQDMLGFFAALEATLYDLGYTSQVGKGVEVFIKKYNEAIK